MDNSEAEWTLTSFSAKIVIKDANEMRGICAWACNEAYTVIINMCYINNFGFMY